MDLDAFCVTFPDTVEQTLRSAYGIDKWASIKASLKTAPKSSIARVHTLQCSAKEAYDRLQTALKEFYDRQSDEMNAVKPFYHAIFPDMIVIPSLPGIPIKYEEKLPSVIVDRLCGEAVLRGSDIYARGIMACSAHTLADRVNIFVDLDHVSTRGCHFSLHKGRKLFIAHGTLVMPRSDIFRVSRGLSVTDIERVCHNAPPMNGVLEECLYAQNYPSAVVGHILAPKPGDTVLDMCAAPGGKTSHIATLMEDSGLLVACDRSRRKAKALAELLQVYAIKAARVICRDATQLLLPKEEGGKSKERSVQAVLDRQLKPQSLSISGFYPETFDRILVDPPCSALGLRPRLVHARDDLSLEQYVKVQRNLLWVAVRLLKPKGFLVYSTCTIHPQENEQMVAHLLKEYPCLELVPPFENALELRIGDSGLPSQGLSNSEADLVQRFDPSNDTIDSIGFFCAKFQKMSSLTVDPSKNE